MLKIHVNTCKSHKSRVLWPTNKHTNRMKNHRSNTSVTDELANLKNASEREEVA